MKNCIVVMDVIMTLQVPAKVLSMNVGCIQVTSFLVSLPSKSMFVLFD